MYIRSSLLWLAMLASLSTYTGAAAQTVVIVNADNATRALSARDVRKLFLGKSRILPDGSRAVLVSLDSMMSDFNRRALRKGDSQVSAAWSRLLFSGRAEPPREFSRASEVIDFIATTPNAIGYIDEASINDSVKVVHRVR